MSRPFVHLHLHSEYSLLDGAARLDRLFNMCKELDMPAVAITDHGNMFGTVEMFKAAAKATDPSIDYDKFVNSGTPFTVKPIIGCEVYACEDLTVKQEKGGKPKLDHLVLLCKDAVGYKNLVKLVSIAYVDGFYFKPRIDYKLLRQYSEGLVCLSACLSGRIPKALLQGNYELAKKHALEFKEIFGGDFYIEIQDHGIPEQREILSGLISLARELDIELVATNDVHYLAKENAENQRILQCISYRTDISRFKHEKQGFSTDEFYLKSGEEMEKVFPNLQGALDNTLKIAEKCNYRMKFGEQLYPEYDTPKGFSASEYLTHLTRQGLMEKYGAAKYEDLEAKVRERSEYELSVIINMGFADYYLIVWDFIHYAEKNKISVGPGRGSGVGSIIAYAIGITKVEPLKYDLLFERFLNPERVSSPDFDIDFCFEGRDKVISYVVEKYGADKVAQIVTFGTLASKAAVKDVGRVLGVSYTETDRISKIMGIAPNGTSLNELLGKKKNKKGEDLSVSEFIELYKNDENARRIIDIAIEVEGMPRNTSMHAAGVVICRDVISDHVPLQRLGEDITTEYNMTEIEKLGMLKMDFLGLRTLTDIDKTVKLIKEGHGVDIDFYNMEYNDPKVFNQIANEVTHGVFQLEGGGMKRFMHDLQPSCIEDIIAGVALYRPGPMSEIPNYIAGKRDVTKIQYDAPVLEPILRVTYGVIVYQEQVMQIVREMAGYTFGRADTVRRMMSKKKDEEMKRERQIFLYGSEELKIEGAIKRGTSEQAASTVFDKMLSFAAYAFNKSHAAAYAYLAYQTAYLLTYYPVEYMTSVLNNRLSKLDEVKHYLNALKEMKIPLLKPDVNKSYALFTVDGEGIRAGLGAIKGVGVDAIDAITAERDKNGVYTDFYDFVYRQSTRILNRKMLESLIYAGVFDSFNIKRSQLLFVYDKVLDRVNKEKSKSEQGQLTFFDIGVLDSKISNAIEYPHVPELETEEKLKREKEVLGVYISGHPLDKYVDELKDFNFNTGLLAREGGGEDDTEESGFYFDDNPYDEDAASQEIPLITDRMQVTAGGVISDIKRIKVKSTGAEMASATLEDLHGSIKLMVNGKKYNQLKGILRSDMVASVKGSLSLKDEEPLIWVDNIEPIDIEENAVSNEKICIYFSFSRKSEGFKETLRLLFKEFNGLGAVYFKDTDDGKLYKTEYTADISTPLQNELFALVGADNVKIIKE